MLGCSCSIDAKKSIMSDLAGAGSAVDVLAPAVLLLDGVSFVAAAEQKVRNQEDNDK